MQLVLSTMREILKFKDSTTIAEVSKYSGLKIGFVLSVINNNGRMVWRDRKSGKITKVDPRSVLVKELKDSGKFYKFDSYGLVSKEGVCLTILGEPYFKLPDNFYESVNVGLFGSTQKASRKIIPVESEEQLKSLGFKLLSSVGVNDRLWNE